MPVASRALTTRREPEASGAAASSVSSSWLRTGTAGWVACPTRPATVSGLRTCTTSDDTVAPAASAALTGTSSRSPAGASASFKDFSVSAGAAPAGTGSACPATVTEPMVNPAVPGWPMAWRAVHTRFERTTSAIPLAPPRTSRPMVTVDDETPPSAAAWLSAPVRVMTPGTPSSGPRTLARDAGDFEACASSRAVGAEGTATGAVLVVVESAGLLVGTGPAVSAGSRGVEELVWAGG